MRETAGVSNALKSYCQRRSIFVLVKQPGESRFVRDDLTPQEKPGAAKEKLAGDLQELSTQELSDAESVEELTEEGQDLEGELIKGIEDAPEAEQGQVKTHKFLQKDAFKDRNRLRKNPSHPKDSLHNLIAASFFRSFRNCRSCSCRDFSSGARKMEDGWTVTIT